MPNRYALVTIALVVWTIFGTLIVVPGAYFILGYSLIQNAITFGACFGALTGLVVGMIGVSPFVSDNRVSAFRWVLFGSMIGALIGAVALLWIGGFPKRSQADLSLVFVAPASLLIGAVCGMVCAVVLWRRQRSH
ncbi:MAG: hypothetical protein KME13_08570 [Myxacorys californica WJT36-NPBG1]|jgi:hypothetical protein|nr:hypothetical protein [Myxacorys californica WJT36-NPBG1]